MKHPSNKSVGWTLVQASRLHRSRIGDKLSSLGLFAGQEQVLQALLSHETISMGDLAEMLRVRPSTASKTISRLSTQGFVKRKIETDDGRVVKVMLTEEGAAKANEINKLWDDVEEELLDGFDNKERRRLKKLLRRAARNLAGLTGVNPIEMDAHDEEDPAEV